MRGTIKRKPRKPGSLTKNLRGWIPDLPDHRDFLFAAIRQAPAKLPKAVDLSPVMSPVEDQGQLGSCTANALAGALEFLELKAGRPLVDFSRLFIYYNERALEHSIGVDAGAMLRDGIKVLATQGACAEKKWPYDIAKFTKKPSAACYRDASRHTTKTYHRLVSLGEMRACLAEGYPFVFGFSVYEGFESARVAKTGVLELPKASERQLGGHAVCAVGYDDKAKRIIVRNSWGTGWGMEGYFTMPYDYVSNRDLSDDFWTLRA
jgi:C1A family cysteine protease